MVADLRAHAAEAGFPPVLLFFQGTLDDGAAFFDRLWPEARAVSDTPLTFYSAFGIERGGWREMFGADVWACGVRATVKGHTIGKPVGDPWIMPGLFLVAPSGAVLWQHDFGHAGDHPDFGRIPALAHAAVTE
jgi:hypothetical protein